MTGKITMGNEQLPDHKRYPAPWWIYVFAGIGLLLTIVGFIIPECFRGPPPEKIAQWASFGDYFGGVVGPLLAFLSFMALLATIVLQTRELRLTREDINTTKEIAQEQKESIVLQRVETTFFHLLNRQHTIRDKITFASASGLEAFSLAHDLVEKYIKQPVSIEQLFLQANAKWQSYPATDAAKRALRENARLDVGEIGRDIVFLNGVQDKFRSYAQSLEYLVRFVHTQPKLAQNASLYLDIIKSQLTDLEELFLLRFSIRVEESNREFPFYEILNRPKEDADTKIVEARAFLQALKSAFNPSLRKYL